MQRKRNAKGEFKKKHGNSNKYCLNILMLFDYL